MSTTQSTFGVSGRNLRSTRSSATRTPGTLIVVRRYLFSIRPEIPAWAISRSTRFLPTLMPCSMRSSAWMRGAPWTPRLAAWISLICSVSQASVSCRSDGARVAQS